MDTIDGILKFYSIYRYLKKLMMSVLINCSSLVVLILSARKNFFIYRFWNLNWKFHPIRNFSTQQLEIKKNKQTRQYTTSETQIPATSFNIQFGKEATILPKKKKKNKATNTISALSNAASSQKFLKRDRTCTRCSKNTCVANRSAQLSHVQPELAIKILERTGKKEKRRKKRTNFWTILNQNILDSRIRMFMF